MLKNYYSKYFYILMIVIFIITVDCDKTPLPTGKKNTYTLRNVGLFHSDETKEFCKSFDYVLADVDVIFNDISKITASHVEILKRWEHGKKKFIFYKTTMDMNKLYTDTLAAKLQEFGYITPLTILTPASVLEQYKKTRSIRKAFVIGDDEFIKFVESMGIKTIPSLNSVTYDDYYAGYNGTLDDEVKAVIIAFDLNINLYKMSQAIRYLSNSEVQLFLTYPKSIFLANYYKVWIKKLIIDTKRTKSYIDQLDGMFGDFLVETNHLTDKVLVITTDASGNRIFTFKHGYTPLIIGNWKVKEEIDLEQTYYKVTDWTKLPWC